MSLWLTIHLKKIFMEKEKKINVLITFSIFHKICVKNFYKMDC